MRWLKLLWCWSVSVLATKASTYASVTLFALLLCPDTAAVSSVQKTEPKPLPRILRMHADSAYRASAGVITEPRSQVLGNVIGRSAFLFSSSMPHEEAGFYIIKWRFLY